VNTIRDFRRDKGWTQFELALKVGVQPQAVYLWESGRRTPQVPQLRRLGVLFGICSDEIILEPVQEEGQSPHRPRADRRPGESPPGRDASGRPFARGRDDLGDATPADSSDPDPS
jgi:DNA-binding XRE family transcriptional regulator